MRARFVLQLDGYVFEHMAQPGAFIFPHAPDESAGLAVRTAVCLQAGQRFDQPVNEPFAELAGRPVLQDTQIQDVPDDRKVGPQVGTDEHIGGNDFHSTRGFDEIAVKGY